MRYRHQYIMVEQIYVSSVYFTTYNSMTPNLFRKDQFIPLRLVKKFRSLTLQSTEVHVLTTMKNIKYIFWFFIIKSYTISSDLKVFAIALVSHIVLATLEAFILSWDEFFYSVLTAVHVLCCQQSRSSSYLWSSTFCFR